MTTTPPKIFNGKYFYYLLMHLSKEDDIKIRDRICKLAMQKRVIIKDDDGNILPPQTEITIEHTIEYYE